ncbi:uncharacterized protein LY79DRAFT_347146 [Colletotrichum navitas]|uniref:Uncharacterized protein n=1 Tax=Colletotrichum navitas TaxID=681940 RepID=A0AAD8PRB4_9PEZI|nr:uncharacterized protein LY79DRAFT_347146 [Colletotrichum navitas]KAK1579205.1 hypothetical protein LY79DRAFT_347146 [Colletotrichum navitas]
MAIVLPSRHNSLPILPTRCQAVCCLALTTDPFTVSMHDGLLRFHHVRLMFVPCFTQQPLTYLRKLQQGTDAVTDPTAWLSSGGRDGKSRCNHAPTHIPSLSNGLRRSQVTRAGDLLQVCLPPGFYGVVMHFHRVCGRWASHGEHEGELQGEAAG